MGSGFGALLEKGRFGIIQRQDVSRERRNVAVLLRR
jgi:hypothetical protein